jgi:ADP-ribose pyrophosphatase YjhB (NUDIX family)
MSEETIINDLADPEPRWLMWAREIQALSQTGLHYNREPYQQERNRRMSEIAAEMMAAYGASDLEKVKLVFNDQTGYATPRVDVRGAVFKDGKLLLVRERQDGGWTMPGGWADVGDLPSNSAEREVWEEAGFRVKACKVVGVYDANRIDPLKLFHAYKIVFLCEILSGKAQTSLETSDVRFFSLDEIPNALSSYRTNLRHIRDAFHALQEPGCATAFD